MSAVKDIKTVAVPMSNQAPAILRCNALNLFLMIAVTISAESSSKINTILNAINS